MGDVSRWLTENQPTLLPRRHTSVRFAKAKTIASSGRVQKAGWILLSCREILSCCFGLGSQQMVEQSRDGNGKQLKSLLPDCWNYHTRASLVSLWLVSVLSLFPALRVREGCSHCGGRPQFRTESMPRRHLPFPLLVKQQRFSLGLEELKFFPERFYSVKCNSEYFHYSYQWLFLFWMLLSLHPQ